jgi:hypothetical protein
MAAASKTELMEKLLFLMLYVSEKQLVYQFYYVSAGS